jgi:hypothetical protein
LTLQQLLHAAYLCGNIGAVLKIGVVCATELMPVFCRGTHWWLLRHTYSFSFFPFSSQQESPPWGLSATGIDGWLGGDFDRPHT